MVSRTRANGMVGGQPPQTTVAPPPQAPNAQQAHAPLQWLQVAPAARGAIGSEVAPPPTAAHAQPLIGEGTAESSATGAGRAAVREGLHSLRPFRSSDHNDGEILREIGPEALASHGKAFQQRCDNATPEQRQQLAKQLHYSPVQAAKTTPELRLAVRTALVLAYAKNASPEQLEKLRKTIEGAPPAMRQAILQELQGPAKAYTEIELEKVSPGDVRGYATELEHANAADAAQDPEARADRAAKINEFKMFPPGKDYSDFRLSKGGQTVALARVGYGTLEAVDKDGNKAVSLVRVVTHPGSQGMEALVMEKAVQEATKHNKPLLRFAQTEAQRDQFEHTYGFKPWKETYHPNRDETKTVQLNPQTSDAWEKRGDNQYALREPPELIFPEPRPPQLAR
ncbi:hypothetical protein [Peristeroidobacter soli]|uniref:hypothetical protein n=1 Tax=Peristeroidobacter soli TaxID=2497877 RepID=UPI00101D7E31|nr:hypothetical protein [Peristeroidobacter soli]